MQGRNVTEEDGRGYEFELKKEEDKSWMDEFSDWFGEMMKNIEIDRRDWGAYFKQEKIDKCLHFKEDKK